MGTYQKGFTLLELVIIIGILGMTIAFAAPGLSAMIKNNRISGSANDFVAALQFGKAEAVTRINPVTMCIRNAGGTGCLADGDWHRGWIVFSDLNGDAAVDDDDEVLMVHEALDDRITFRGTGDIANFVTYRPVGTTNIATTAALVMCDDRGYDQSAKAIVVTITGRGAVMKAQDAGEAACL